MLERFFKKEVSDYNKPIYKVLGMLDKYDPDNEFYPTLIDHLERLERLREQEKLRRRVSPDTMAIVVGNLFGILIIVAYEQKHVMVSKGLGHILKPRHGMI